MVLISRLLLDKQNGFLRRLTNTDTPQVLGGLCPIILSSPRSPQPRPSITEGFWTPCGKIQPGHAGALWYHRAVRDLLAALFFPALSNCRIEEEIHNGRKRIDIVFDNVADIGFFRWIGQNYTAPCVPIECKNYSRDPANPELDQIVNRLSWDRGRLGLLVCRNLESKELLRKRCRDTAKDGNGYILALDDRDLEQLVDQAEEASERSLAARLEYPYLRRVFGDLTS